MVTIRLTRKGSKKRPFFRVVVVESAWARDGAFIEILGYYEPRKSPEVLSVDRERVAHWVEKGARLSDTMRTLIARHKNDPAPVVIDPAAAKAASAAPSQASAS